MTIYGASVRFNLVGLRSKSRIYFRKYVVMGLALFCELILIKLYTNVTSDNILNKLAFRPCSSKIKVTAAYGGDIHHL